MANNVFLGLFVTLFIAITYSDFKKREVANCLVLAEFSLCVLASFTIPYSINVLAFFITLAFGFLLWKLCIFGAADIKLCSVLIISIKNNALLEFFMLMSVFGFFIALVVFLFCGDKTVPYAPPIALSHLIIFYNLYF